MKNSKDRWSLLDYIFWVFDDSLFGSQISASIRYLCHLLPSLFKQWVEYFFNLNWLGFRQYGLARKEEINDMLPNGGQNSIESNITKTRVDSQRTNYPRGGLRL